jgi:hypothetical protein
MFMKVKIKVNGWTNAAEFIKVLETSRLEVVERNGSTITTLISAQQ